MRTAAESVKGWQTPLNSFSLIVMIAAVKDHLDNALQKDFIDIFSITRILFVHEKPLHQPVRDREKKPMN